MTLRTITFDDRTHKLVPLEPSNEMTSTLADVLDDPENDRSSWDLSENMYRAMIAAAPEYFDESTYQDKYTAGFCSRDGGCVCGGDLPRVRESCSSWVKPISRHQEG